MRADHIEVRRRIGGALTVEVGELARLGTADRRLAPHGLVGWLATEQGEGLARDQLVVLDGRELGIAVLVVDHEADAPAAVRRHAGEAAQVLRRLRAALFLLA